MYYFVKHFYVILVLMIASIIIAGLIDYTRIESEKQKIEKNDEEIVKIIVVREEPNSEFRAFVEVFRSIANNMEKYEEATKDIKSNSDKQYTFTAKMLNDIKSGSRQIYDKSKNKIYWKAILAQMADLMYDETQKITLTTDNWRGILYMIADYIESEPTVEIKP